MFIDRVFDGFLDLFRPKAITIPPMDGNLRPNSALDDANIIATIPQPDNIITVEGDIWFSSRSSLYKMDVKKDASKPKLVKEYDAEIACMAVAPNNQCAVGLDNGHIIFINDDTRPHHKAIGPSNLTCPTALCFVDDNTLIICQGSSQVSPSNFIHDLMLNKPSGSVWKLDIAAGDQTCLADGLAFPYGVARAGNGDDILVAESWAHRIIKLSTQTPNQRETVMSNLPGYPARLSQLETAGTMLCVFAPRNRLIEFVLQEHELRAQMVSTIAPAHWIAPQLNSGKDFLVPLQQGGVKTMGIHKPWAPSFSYGLVVQLDEYHAPLKSYHSRANGNRHGITSCCQIDGRLFVTSKGNDCILEITNKNGSGTS